MNYSSTLDFLFSQLPIYQRVGQIAYKADLSNTLQLMDILDHPEKKFKSIHIAGTNGKGSTAHLLAAVLQSQGYKTGLYTSPHLSDFRERIKINGKEILQEYVVEFVKKHKKEFLNLEFSFFEMTVGMAFQYFADEKVDIAIIETGLGGRLDSTNVITPEISVITNIGLDHTHLLGENIEKIAAEKAGIIKKNIPVVVGEKQEKAFSVFKKTAKILSAPVYFAEDFDFPIYDCDLKGNYQKKNIQTALATIKILHRQGWSISEDAIGRGIKNASEITGLKGRWQILQEKPLTICDTAHNEDGIKQIVEQIKSTPHRQLHFVLGMVNDKNIEPVLNLLPRNALYYFCQANIPRALDVLVLQEKAREHNLLGQSYISVSKALKTAQLAAHNQDLVFVGGSTFVVAEVV